jgi:hypothetical protein
MILQMSDPVVAQQENMRYGYFPATRTDLKLIAGVWSAKEAGPPAKIIVTSLCVLDLPLSITFDALAGVPVNFLRGNPPPPWREVTEVRLGQASIRLGMSEDAARSALAGAGLPKPWVWYDLWLVRPASRPPDTTRTSATGAIIELHFEGGKIVQMFQYKGDA